MNLNLLFKICSCSCLWYCSYWSILNQITGSLILCEECFAKLSLFLLLLANSVSQFKDLGDLTHYNLVWVPIARYFWNVDWLWSFLMEEWHKNTNLNHVLELVVKWELDNLIIVCVLIKDFFFVLGNKVCDGNGGNYLCRIFSQNFCILLI